jgi:hypothetical protein
MVAILKSRGFSVKLFTLPREVRQFKKKMIQNAGLEAVFYPGDPKRNKSIRIEGFQVTDDPKIAADAEFIVLAVPAFAHGQILENLAAYLSDDVTVGAIPSRSGFELQAHYILRNAGLKRYSIFAAHTLPWACRIVSYGSLVHVLGTKSFIGVAVHPSSRSCEIAAILRDMFQIPFNNVKNILSVSLGNIGQVLHPGIMFGLLRGYEGEVWSEKDIPLFYHGVDADTAEILENLSSEIITLARFLEKKHPRLDLGDVQGVGQWLLTSYPDSISDKSNLQKALSTNSSYRDLRMPVRKTGDVFVPDFKCRYLAEDVPYGLVFSRAVAAMAGVKTPVIDEVISWSSRVLEMEFLIEGELRGKDITSTRIPAWYGIQTVEELVVEYLK